MTKDLAYYMSLPYPILLVPPSEVGETWYVKIPMLEGCMSMGDDKYDALEMIEEAKEVWLMGALKFNDPIPEPELPPIKA